MWKHKQKLYPKLKPFFEKSYLYSEEGCWEEKSIDSDYDQKRYVSALQFRYDYSVEEGNGQIALYRFVKLEQNYIVSKTDIWFCKDVFSKRLIDQLRFVEVDITTLGGCQVMIDYYQNHFAEGLQRKFGKPHE